MKKRLLSMILAFSMMLTILPVNAITALAADDKSGACGDGLTYTMIQNDDGTDTYTLAITGTGAMTDYDYHSAPWDADCGKITKLTIDGATSIGESAFEGCRNLTDVVISSSVTSIGEEAFESCEKLTNTSISSILKEATSIGEGAFRGCTSLTSVEIPESVTSIDVAAFGQCSNLTSVKILGTITSIAKSTFIACGKLRDIAIPVSVTSIGDWAFARCSGLADIKIQENVTSIGNRAFENCTSLTTIKIPDSVTSIGENAFNGCSSLRQVDLPCVIPTISQAAFNNDNTRFYYPGYANDFESYAGKIATGNLGMQSYRVCCYRDVFFDANGGSFADSSTRKKVEKIWRETKLTQVQVDSIGVPKQSGKIFLGWNTVANATTTINPIYGDTTHGTIYYAVYRDAVPAAVTITGLDNTTVKAGEAKEFTVNVTPNDDANTGAKATITVSGADAVEKIQYKDGETWKDVPDEGLSIDKINNTEFKLITKADANDGDVTITVTVKKANDTEIDKKVAAVTVKKHENAAVTITGLDGTTVKAGEAKDFTVNVTPNDDIIDKMTFGTTSGEVQWSNDGGNTWTPVSGDVAYSDLTGKQFRVVPAADAANGTVTVTVTAKKADGTEIAKTASFTVTAREHATVEINELNGKTIKQNKAYTFTVTVTAHDDGGETTLKFDNVAGLTHNGTAVTDAGVTVALTKNQSKPLNFTLTPDAEGAGKTLTATLNNGATDTATYTVSEYEHAKVTIDGLGTDLKQGESKDFTVKVDPKDDSGNAIIDFGDKNSEIQYKDGEDWKPMPSGGLKINLSNGEKTYDFRITPKNDGSQTLTATVKQNDNELDKVEQTYTVAKKDEPTTPGGGENPGENPGGGSTGDGGNTKPGEKPDRKIKIDGGIVEVNGKEVKPDEDGNITVKKGDEITVTVDKSKISDAQVFDQWVIKPDSVLNEVDPKSEKISFTMPAEDVTIEAMTRDASIEDDGPGILGTGALIATGVVGSAALLYQGHMLGTELYLRYLLPHGAVIPQNRAELAVLLWQDAENPEPVSTTLYSDISEDDSAIQQAARWAVENDLMEQLDADEHPDHFDPFVPVTFSDSIRAWKKAQELKK